MDVTIHTFLASTYTRQGYESRHVLMSLSGRLYPALFQLGGVLGFTQEGNDQVTCFTCFTSLVRLGKFTWIEGSVLYLFRSGQLEFR